MPIGITNATTITLQNLTEISNVSNYPEFAIKVTHDIYSGYLFFIILWILWIILFLRLNDRDEQILNNIMYTSSALTIPTLFLRAIEIVRNGVLIGLISDAQFWIFPIMAILSAAIIWATKNK